MIIREPTPEERAEWDAWLATRPPAVRAIAERFQPWHLYRLKETQQRIILLAISENGTLRVSVPLEYNPTRTNVGHGVFGISPEDIEDLPETEHEVIEKEVAMMAPLTELRDAAVKELWSPEGIERTRKQIREQHAAKEKL